MIFVDFGSSAPSFLPRVFLYHDALFLLNLGERRSRGFVE